MADLIQCNPTSSFAGHNKKTLSSVSVQKEIRESFNNVLGYLLLFGEKIPCETRKCVEGEKNNEEFYML